MRVGRTIYLDHQATTPLSEAVATAMEPYLRGEFGNPHSADHSIGWKAAKAVEGATASVASIIGADPNEIFFTSGATEANNLALLGLARGPLGKTRKRILVSAIEHKSVLAAARALKEHYEFQVDHIAVNREGVIDLEHLKRLISDDVLLVSVMAVNNEVGSLQPLDPVANICRAHGALFHSDCAQAVGAIDTDYFSNVVDLASVSSHKMYGPTGVGALYIRRELHSSIEPIIYGGGQQQNIRSGTVPLALCIGMGAAAKLIFTEELLQANRAMSRLRASFLEGVKKLGFPVVVNGPDLDYRHPGNINIRFTGMSAHDILASLQPHVAASTGSACTSGIPEPSHVLRAMGLTDEEAQSSVRFSIGRMTTEADITEALLHLHQVLSRASELQTAS